MYVLKTTGNYLLSSSCSRFLHIANGLRHMMGIRSDDIIYCTLPLYHTNGGILGAGQVVIIGATLALRKKFSASQFWNDCVKYKCTVSGEWVS